MRKVLVTIGYEDLVMSVGDATTLFKIMSDADVVTKLYESDGYKCEVKDRKMQVILSNEKIKIYTPEPESESEPEPVEVVSDLGEDFENGI